jgi:hypothetical protein
VTCEHHLAPHIALHLQRRFPHLLLAGHSKGGGVALYTSIMAGIRMVGFNSVGMSARLVRKVEVSIGRDALVERRRQISHYMVEGDLVSNFGGQATGGMSIAGPLAEFLHGPQRHLAYRNNLHVLPSRLGTHQHVRRHFIRSMANALRENKLFLTRPFGRGPEQTAKATATLNYPVLNAAIDITPYIVPAAVAH